MIRQFGWFELQFLVEAARWTLALSAIAFAGGGLLGLVVAAARVGTGRIATHAAAAWITVIQGVPLLVLLFGFYFGLDVAGLRLPAIVAAALGLSVYASAFLGEIWEGCLRAVPAGQWEGAAALGLTRGRALRLVILPQALRIAVPPTVGFMVQIVKNTSLAAIIGFVELSRAGQLVNNATFQPFRVFVTVAAIYFAICFPLSWLSRRLERAFRAGVSLPVQGS